METTSQKATSRDRGDSHRLPRAAYRRPIWLFVAAAAVLVVSIFLPYWRLNLHAPQYPAGLIVNVFVNRMEGDVQELEGLNHYVGLPGFDEGAQAERQIAVAAISAIVGLLIAGTLIHNKWIVLFALPALAFPFFFLADLQYWLWHYGHSLDPAAPFADAVGEFTPPVIGPAEIAQFDTWAFPHVGLVLAFLATGLVATGLWFHRKVYRRP